MDPDRIISKYTNQPSPEYEHLWHTLSKDVQNVGPFIENIDEIEDFFDNIARDIRNF